jgi:hypothetical protein
MTQTDATMTMAMMKMKMMTTKMEPKRQHTALEEADGGARKQLMAATDGKQPMPATMAHQTICDDEDYGDENDNYEDE